MVDGSGLQGCVLGAALRAQAAGRPALSVGDPHGHPGLVEGLSEGRRSQRSIRPTSPAGLQDVRT